MKDLSPEEAGRWMAAAPSVVRETVTSEKTQQVIDGIGKKYALHVDVTGLLYKHTSYMLLGYAGPDEFLKELIAAQIPENDAKAIMTEINQKIFVPLREQMRQESSATPEQARPVQQPVQQQTQSVRVPPSQSINRISYAPTPAPTQQSPQAQRPVQSVQAAPPIQQRPVNQQAPRATSGPSLRDVLTTVTGSARPLESKKLLEDHEEPHIEFHKPPAQAFVPMPQAPRVPPPLVPTPTQRNFPPPQNLPGTLPPQNVPKPTPIPSRPYTSDPYREPLE